MTEAVRLQPGDEAPDFTLPTDAGKPLSLKDLRGRKVVLYAYPAAMTPGCTTQACDFRDNIASLRGGGYEVVGISPDSPAQLAKFRERDDLTFPLVGDEDRKVLTAYGAYGEAYGRREPRRPAAGPGCRFPGSRLADPRSPGLRYAVLRRPVLRSLRPW